MACASVTVIVMSVCSMGGHEGYEEGNDLLLVVSQGFISNLFHQRLVSFPELRSQVWSMYVIHSFPGVMCIGVSNPLDSVLEPFGAPEVSRSHDLLHFPLQFTFYDVWGWFVVVRSMLLRFLIWGEE